ncbi:MAG: zinc-binding alcohol dehydrogenase [Proteobacteria bacterium]|nr:zinc-binding alcohol dehydrogenase [Pseudomonadota bacterium]
MSHSEALWYTAPGQAEHRTVELPGAGDVTLEALYSGISRGTETLVLQGRVPRSEHARMRCPLQEGNFPFPVKYGYALVGRVLDGPAHLKGEHAFVLHPHQRTARVPLSFVRPLPKGLPPKRACLAANMETALNVTWDAQLAPGQKVLIIGGGVLGLLTAAVASSVPNTQVTVVDVLASRAGAAQKMGANFAPPAAAPTDQDVVIHTSATEDGLLRALECAAFEAKIVEASWYGERTVTLPLGAAFHAQRLQIISSQVGSVAPSHRGSVTHAARMARALDLLQDEKFDALITGEIPFDEAPKRLPAVLSGDSSGLMTVLRY